MAQFKINYKEYPECMFAMIAAYLPAVEGKDLRLVAGSVVFRSEDKNGNTYKNGLLHSYNDQHALNVGNKNVWYKNGVLHREGDLPAVVDEDKREWWYNGERHREGDLPAVIDVDRHEWYKYGKRHREGDLPAVIQEGRQEWWVNSIRHREGGLPAIIDVDDGIFEEWWVDGKFISNNEQ